MRHEKIFKREDGSRVRVNIEFRADWSYSKPEWYFSVDTCEKGKRTWVPACNGDDYFFRKLTMAERAKAVREESLKRASIDEVKLAMLELWDRLRPSEDNLGTIH